MQRRWLDLTQKRNWCFGRSCSLSTIPITFLRHGQSTWNQQNIFIGMTDTPLTEDGVKEAKMAGRLLASDERTQRIDVVYTS